MKQKFLGYSIGVKTLCYMPSDPTDPQMRREGYICFQDSGGPMFLGPYHCDPRWPSGQTCTEHARQIPVKGFLKKESNSNKNWKIDFLASYSWCYFECIWDLQYFWNRCG